MMTGTLLRRAIVAVTVVGYFVVSVTAVHITKQQAHGRRKDTKIARRSERCVVDGQTKRIAFFHIPKTGTSFGSVIAHYVNSSLPDDAAVPDCEHVTCTHVSDGGWGQIEFQYRYPTDTWFKDCMWEKPGHGPNNVDWFAHSRVTTRVYDDFKGRFVGMFRNPKQRALSSFNGFVHMRVELYGIETEHDWAVRIEGTAVKMLAGQEYPLEARPDKKMEQTAIVPNVKLALSRLDGFLFAGLVEQYGLSVCLFHVVTGTKWGSHDVDNMRRLNKSGGDKWDESVLSGYTDPYDTPLYLEVQKRFWLAVEQYQLSAEKCQQLYPEMDHSDFL
eukprot:TRINITY_DN1568_c0_g1_i1.p1 TRINITY_DN1568_c0_g1~~TRINITY_DN1568_c0_g1_i1.p1  ORF type:complete len:352 (-),score=40.85 TRINITY_DN1568_c0_g1_i1:217-1206(-)